MASHAANIVIIQKCYLCGKETVIEDTTLKNFCCKQAVVNMIKAKIGIDIGRNNYNIEEVKVLSIQELDVKVEEFLAKDNNKNCLDLEELRENSLLFWNLVYAFSKANLPFKFFAPYDRNTGGDMFRIILLDDEKKVVDITPQNHNDKEIQTELDNNYLNSILGY